MLWLAMSSVLRTHLLLDKAPAPRRFRDGGVNAHGRVPGVVMPLHKIKLGARTGRCGWGWKRDSFREALSEEGILNHEDNLLIHTRSYGAAPLGSTWDLQPHNVDLRKLGRDWIVGLFVSCILTSMEVPHFHKDPATEPW